MKYGQSDSVPQLCALLPPKLPPVFIELAADFAAQKQQAEDDPTVQAVVLIFLDNSRADSDCLPFLPVEKLADLLARRNESDETTWIRGFREWVRTLKH